jgi:hypothetical protein
VNVCLEFAARLNPVLLPSPFQPTFELPADHPRADRSSDGHWTERFGTLLWCADYRTLDQRCPWIIPTLDRLPGTDDVCVDLTITISDGDLVEVDLDGQPLTNIFSTLNNPEYATAAGQVIDKPALSVSSPVAELLRGLLTRAAG